MAGKGLEELVLLGKVSKAHGIRGEIKVYPYSGDPEQFVRNYQRLYLTADPESLPAEYAVEKSRVQGGQVLLQLKNCSDRTTAEMFKGFQVYGNADDLPDLAEDELYLHALLGKEVVDTAGTLLGTCSHFIDTGAHDLLVVQQAGKEYLIPVVGDFIVAVEGNRVVLDLPPGLLEINE